MNAITKRILISSALAIGTFLVIIAINMVIFNLTGDLPFSKQSLGCDCIFYEGPLFTVIQMYLTMIIDGTPEIVTRLEFNWLSDIEVIVAMFVVYFLIFSFKVKKIEKENLIAK